jgi:hypothetical protein
MDPLPGDVIVVRPGEPLPADKAPSDQLRADPGPEPCGIPEAAAMIFAGLESLNSCESRVSCGTPAARHRSGIVPISGG